MSIDVHAHLYPPKYMSFVNTLAHDTSPAAEAFQATIHDLLITQVRAFQNALDERIVMMDQEANFSSSEIEQVLSSNIASKLGLATRAIHKNTNDSSMV